MPGFGSLIHCELGKLFLFVEVAKATYSLKAAINGGCPFNAQLLSDMSHANVLTQAQ